ncbi:MAG: 50S ribosomal protein L30 [SAR86 cluster bacterium]|uniref:50S ribosomal protein L30 n=1 Tax=SAR86 cluster bacterium TaxID=2030880 RepID=A0A2A4MNZ4_9GAMM|nr:MAG: 50S ribosomal protein L30 [SAR86 cluster bacterium]
MGALPRHKLCLQGLGLRRIRQSVEVEDTPANRGMINKISYMLNIESEG